MHHLYELDVVEMMGGCNGKHVVEEAIWKIHSGFPMR